MIEFFSYSTPAAYDGCLYGSEDRRNNQLKRDQAVGLLLCLTIFFLFQNENLRRLYTPLARIVDISLVLKLCDCFVYFAYYPYAENEGNCADIVISRVYNAVIMVGELHQIYFLANFLGLGRLRFWKLSLSQLLNIFSIAVLVTVLGSMYFRKLLLIRGLWTFSIAAIQIYVIRMSRQQSLINDSSIINGNNSSVKLFEKLSICQLLPSMFSFMKRIFGVFGISLFGNLVSVPNVMDEVCVLLFYLKVLVIVENAELSIEIVED